MKQNNINRSSKKICVLNWWKSKTDDEFYFKEFYSYLNSYTDSIYNLAMILNYYNMPPEKIIEYSKQGKLITYLESNNTFIEQIKEKNNEIYNKINIEFYNDFKNVNKVKKL